MSATVGSGECTSWLDGLRVWARRDAHRPDAWRAGAAQGAAGPAGVRQIGRCRRRASGDLVDEWTQQQGIVDIELNLGDIEFHRPNLLHCSGPNTSAGRRCGPDIGHIPTSTTIRSDGLYLDPLLVRGRPVAGINPYRRSPEHTPGETTPFEGLEKWNPHAAARNSTIEADDTVDVETPLGTTNRMIARLREGTVTR
ncbi:phytanoyl-CoA dioxygenase family protein [Amycolatopsis sp. NPDC026612]|uniref:phytanoyl-CoA dioxygenase family protein n=1 Tax=Amycolatopsis sp. NPDC026612 TaxID=3155466 RepID=UPI0033D754E2